MGFLLLFFGFHGKSFQNTKIAGPLQAQERSVDEASAEAGEFTKQVCAQYFTGSSQGPCDEGKDPRAQGTGREQRGNLGQGQALKAQLPQTCHLPAIYCCDKSVTGRGERVNDLGRKPGTPSRRRLALVEFSKQECSGIYSFSIDKILLFARYWESQGYL